MTVKALNAFSEARQLYQGQQFASARERMKEYRNTVDYFAFAQWDKRPVSTAPPIWTVVVVSYGTGEELLKCLDGIFLQKNTSFEVVLVNNGNNESIKQQLNNYTLCYIEPPVNLLPSEGRNIGAKQARGRYLAFIDDDGLISPDYLQEGERALEHPEVIGARGRIVPKTYFGATSSHYDMGSEPKPATFNLEGNMVIRTDVFDNVGGFDPLMFGCEGRELTARCMRYHPQKIILYWPKLILKHDFASGDRLYEKRKRQKLGLGYIKSLPLYSTHVTVGSEVSKGGLTEKELSVSIIINTSIGIAATEAFLRSINKINVRNPIEIIINENRPRDEYLKLLTRYPCLRIAILPISNKTLSEVARKLRYNTVVLLFNPDESFANKLSSLIENCYMEYRAKGNEFISGCVYGIVIDKNIAINIEEEFAQLNLRKIKKLLKYVSTNNYSSQLELNDKFEDYFDDKKFSLNSKYNQRKHPAGKINSYGILNGEESTESLSFYESITPSDKVSPLISFVVPVYNKKDSLKACVESVLPLVSLGLEMIFVDDKSTDNSLFVLNSLASHYGFIKIVELTDNGGASKARNIGLRHVRSKFVMFLDADDTINAAAIKVILYNKEYQSADIIRGKIIGVTPIGKRVELAKESLLHKADKANVRWKDEPSLWFYWYFTACIFRYDFLTRNFINFPEGMRNEDPVFLCRTFLSAEKISLVNQVFYFYTVDPKYNKKRSSCSFLYGWVLGYFNIYTMIQGHELARQYFLLNIPSLIKHSVSIVNSFTFDEAAFLLKRLKIMFSKINIEYVENPGCFPVISVRHFPKDEENFIRMLINNNVEEIYRNLISYSNKGCFVNVS